VYTDVGKVLTGIQVPPEEYAEFDDFLKTLGYHFVEETHNEVYKRYLRSC
jgi:threonine dehydratase